MNAQRLALIIHIQQKSHSDKLVPVSNFYSLVYMQGHGNDYQLSEHGTKIGMVRDSTPKNIPVSLVMQHA